MSYLTVESAGVAEGTFTIPRLGRAIAELRTTASEDDTTFNVGDKVTASFDGGPSYKMAVLRADLELGCWRLLLAGGAGGLSQPVKPKFYSSVPPATVVSDLLREVNEQSGTIDLSGSLDAWARMGGTAAEALGALLVKFPGYAWRVLPDGTVWVGKETWPAGPVVGITEAHPAAHRYVLVADSTLAPGINLDGIGNVIRVVQHIGRHLCTEVWADG